MKVRKANANARTSYAHKSDPGMFTLAVKISKYKNLLTLPNQMCDFCQFVQPTETWTVF